MMSTFSIASTFFIATATLSCNAAPENSHAPATTKLDAKVTHSVANAGAKANTASPSAGLASVMARAHYAFRPGAAGFAGRGDGYRVTVGVHGEIAFAMADDEARGRAPFVIGAGVSADAGAGSPRREDDGSITIARSEAIERITNDARGVEIAWKYAARPAGHADLHVPVSTAGYSYISTNQDGAHFRSPSKDGAGTARDRGIRIGTATWVDAVGARTRVSSHREGDALVFDVPRTLLEHTMYPATLDPLIGPEGAGDTPITAPSTQITEWPTTCASASMFYVAWVDNRRLPENPEFGSFDLFGARIDPATGNAVAADAAGVLLVPDLIGAGGQVAPACASDGTNFAVAVEDQVVHAVRVDGATGQPIAEDAGGRVVGAINFFDAQPSIAFASGDGSAPGTYVMAWNNASAILSSRFGATGAPLATNELLFTNLYAVVTPSVACASAGCITTFLSEGDYLSHYVRIDPKTGPLAADVAAPPSVPLGNAYVTAAGYGAGGYFLTFRGLGQNAEFEIVFDSGLDVTGFDPASGALTGNAYQIFDGGEVPNALSFDGTHFVIGLSGGGSDIALFFDPVALTLAGADTLTGLSSTSGIASVSSINGTSLATDVNTVGNGEIVTARLDGKTRAVVTADVGGVVISKDANAETKPAIASNGSGALLAWTDDRFGPSSIVMAHLDKNGNVEPADAAGVVLYKGYNNAQGFFGGIGPAIATDGTDYIVVWYQGNITGSEIDGVRIDGTTGKVTETLPTLIDPSAASVNYPAIAYGDGKYAIAYATGVAATANIVDAKTLAVTAGPLVYSTPPRTDAPVVFSFGAQLAYGAGSFLMAWDRYGTMLEETAAVRFSSAGVTHDGDGNGVIVTTDEDGASGISAASNGNSYILTWLDSRDPAVANQIYARVFGIDQAMGAVPDVKVGGGSFDFTFGVDDVPTTTVVDAKDGLSYSVVWGQSTALYGALVGYDGVVRDASPLIVAADPGYYAHPSLTSVSPGAMMLAYSRYVPDAGIGDYRVRARTLTTGPLAGACTTADDCASRNCQDGFCCDTPCTGSCETCAAPGSVGKCTRVVNAVDPDTCTAKTGSTCNAEGACTTETGKACDSNAACASGFCSDDVCCNTACNGACDVCNASAETAGTCTVVVAGSVGSPSCAPGVCNGTSASCPTTCASDADCVRPYACDVHNVCTLLTVGECTDSVTLKSPNGLLTKCTPYRCETSACTTSCKSIADCADGYICGEAGTCIAATPDDGASGCAVSRASGESDAPSDAWLWLLGAPAIVTVRRRRAKLCRQGLRRRGSTR